MGDSKNKAQRDLEKFKARVGEKEKRKMHILQHGKQSVWFGLGMFGLIGWSVAVPTLLGIFLGIWLDKQWRQEQMSWTLTLLFVGIFVGCLNAWYWFNREREKISPLDNKQDENEKTP